MRAAAAAPTRASWRGGPRPTWCVAVLVGMVAAVLSGCGGGGEGATKRRTNAPLTASEAAALAEVLYRNTQHRGAVVAARLPLDSGAEVTLHGRIDFRRSAGAFEVGAAGNAPLRLYFTRDRVITEAPPELRRQLAANGHPGVRYIADPPDPDRKPVDRAIAYIASLATHQRDNPLLVRQGKARWVRDDKLDGTPVMVLSYGPLTTYWIGKSDGELYRAEAKLPGFAEPVTVTFVRRGPQRIAGPPGRAVLSGRAARRLLRSSRG